MSGPGLMSLMAVLDCSANRKPGKPPSLMRCLSKPLQLKEVLHKNPELPPPLDKSVEDLLQRR